MNWFFDWMDRFFDDKCKNGTSVHNWRYHAHYPFEYPHTEYICECCGERKTEYGEITHLAIRSKPTMQRNFRSSMHEQLDAWIDSKQIKERLTW